MILAWRTLVVAHAVPTLFLTGLIWFVQHVHYALYPAIGDEQFLAYERAHCRRITPIVLPMMVGELALGGWLVLAAPDAAAQAAAIAGALLLAVVWGATFLIQVPCHAVLEQRVCRATMRRLVASNWLRTIAWTLRAGIAVWLLLRA